MCRGWPSSAFARRHQQSPFAAIVSSDLIRARQTADVVGQALDLPVTENPALRERHYGQFEGKTPAEAAIFAADAYAALVSRADLDALPGEAESLRAMVYRIESCLVELVQRYADQSVVLVTHGGVLDVMYRRAMGRELTGPRDAPIPNAGLNWLDLTLENGQLRWSMVAWGETAHLTDASLDEIL